MRMTQKKALKKKQQRGRRSERKLISFGNRGLITCANQTDLARMRFVREYPLSPILGL
jgi:hypothetical protein